MLPFKHSPPKIPRPWFTVFTRQMTRSRAIHDSNTCSPVAYKPSHEGIHKIGEVTTKILSMQQASLVTKVSSFLG